MTSQRRMIWNAYRPILRRYRLWLVILTIFMVLTTCTKAVIPFFVARMFARVIETDTTGTSAFQLLLPLVLLYVVHLGLWTIYDVIIYVAKGRSMRDIDIATFAAVQRQSLRFFEGSFAGSLVTSARRLRLAWEFMLNAYAFQLGRAVIMILLSIGIFWWKDSTIALFFTSWCVAFCIGSYVCARWRMRYDVVAARADSRVSAMLADSFSNHATVKIFARERNEQQRFNDVAQDYCSKRIRSWSIGSLINRTMHTFLVVLELGILWFMLAKWKNGTATVEDIIFYQTYIFLFIQQIWELGNQMSMMFQHVADAEEMAEIYSLKPEVRDTPNARPLQVECGGVEFQSNHFRYLDDVGDVHDVHDFSLKIAPGESVGIVGPSGAGKSTIVKLLLRFYDLNMGRILIDMQDIANVTQESLRQLIALVTQDTNLFHRTLRENIAFGRPDATEGEIIEAAKRAHAWDFISSFRDGLDTLVGERGVKLSGGERQRIALARAFLADTPILVFDEATSAVDSHTEEHIQESITQLLQMKRTTIVIAHRLSTIMQMDRIVVMDHGKILEIGTHDELLEEDGLYASLWRRQSGGYLSSK